MKWWFRREDKQPLRDRPLRDFHKWTLRDLRERERDFPADSPIAKELRAEIVRQELRSLRPRSWTSF